MTLTEYAKHRAALGLRGQTAMAVSKAIAVGRLTAGRDAQGRPTIPDAAQADREWDSGRRAPVRMPMREAEPANDAPIEGVPSLAKSLAIKEAAAARAMISRAEIIALDLEKRRGRLIDAIEARRDVDDKLTLVKTRLLGVPSRLAQRMPQYAADVVPVLDALIREALEELANHETKRAA